MRLERVKIKIDPYPNVSRTHMAVTVSGPGQALAGGVWRGGREVTVETHAADANHDMRSQLMETLAHALDQLAALDPPATDEGIPGSGQIGC